MVSEMSVCGELAPLLCASGEVKHHDGQSIWWTKVACFLAARKEEVGSNREREGTGECNSVGQRLVL